MSLEDYVLKEQNRIMALRRKVGEATRMPEVMRRNTPAYRKHGSAGSQYKHEQRQIVNWLLSNEKGKHYDPMRGKGDPRKENAAAETIEKHREALVKVVMENLPPDANSRQDIEPVFQRVYKSMLGGKPEKAQESEQNQDPEAAAIQRAFGAEKPKEKLPEGLKRDKNGWLRFTKDNKWGKQPGSRASENLLG